MKAGQDEALVRSCLEGDKRAFETLVAKYEKTLYNAAYRVVNDAEDAMDATQTAFVKAYEKLNTFDPAYRFFSWIYRILLNEALTIVNKRKRFDQWDSEVIAQVRSPRRNPEQTFDITEIDDHLQHAMMELKTDYRIVIVLKHFQDFSYREMSELIGIPEKTVKSRLFTARQQLKDILSKRGIVG